MATHSSILAWKAPWREEPGGLQSMGSQSRTQLKRLSMQAGKEHLKALLFFSCNLFVSLFPFLHLNSMQSEIRLYIDIDIDLLYFFIYSSVNGP